MAHPILSLCVTVLVATVSTVANAEKPTRIRLEWAEDDCLKAELFRLAVAQRVRRHLIVQEGATATLTGRAVPHVDGGWQIELTLGNVTGALLGQRVLYVESSSCEALRAHAVLVAAMLVDSLVDDGTGGNLEPPVTEPEARPGQIETTLPHQDRPELPPQVNEQPSPQSFQLRLGPALSVRRLPGIRLGASFGLGWRWGAGEVHLRILAFEGAKVKAQPGGESSLRYQALDATSCHRVAGSLQGRFSLCLGMRTGSMRASGAEFRKNRKQNELLLDLLAELSIERDLWRPLFVDLRLGTQWALLRPRFGYESTSEQFAPLYSPDLFAAEAQLSIGLRFP